MEDAKSSCGTPPPWVYLIVVAVHVVAAADPVSDDDSSRMDAWIDEGYGVDGDGKIWNMDGIHIGNMDDGTVTAV